MIAWIVATLALSMPARASSSACVDIKDQRALHDDDEEGRARVVAWIEDNLNHIPEDQLACLASASPRLDPEVLAAADRRSPGSLCDVQALFSPGTRGADLVDQANAHNAAVDTIVRDVRTLLWQRPDPAAVRIVDPIELFWVVGKADVGVRPSGWSEHCYVKLSRWEHLPGEELDDMAHVEVEGGRDIVVHGLLDGRPDALVASAAAYLTQMRSTPSGWGHGCTYFNYARPVMSMDFDPPRRCDRGRGERLAVDGVVSGELLAAIVTGYITGVGWSAEDDGVRARSWSSAALWSHQLGRAANDEQAIVAVSDALLAFPIPRDQQLREELRLALRAFWRAGQLSDLELQALIREILSGQASPTLMLVSSGVRWCSPLQAFFARRYASSEAGPDLIRLYRWAMARSAAKLGLPEAGDWARSVLPEMEATTHLDGRDRYLADLQRIANSGR